MIVHDNDGTAVFARSLLLHEGYGVIAPGTCEKAVNWLGYGIVDPVPLDSRLPGIDGIETCRWIYPREWIPWHLFPGIDFPAPGIPE